MVEPAILETSLCWSARRSLEDRPNDIIPRLVEISIAARKSRIELERQMCLERERQRLHALAIDRSRHLEADLPALRRATDLRQLIYEVRNRAIGDGAHRRGILPLDWASREVCK